MAYSCSVCGEKIEGDLVTLQEHTDKHIIDLLKYDHPEWVKSNGICPKCVEYYRTEIQGGIFKDAPCAIRNRKIKRFWRKLKGLFTLRQ